MQTQLNNFVSRCEMKNYSHRTIEGFKNVLSDFNNYLSLKGYTQYDQVEIETIDNYLLLVSKRPLSPNSRYKDRTNISPNTVRRYARNVRSYWKRLFMRKVVNFSHDLIAIPKEQKQKIDFLEQGELEKLY